MNPFLFWGLVAGTVCAAAHIFLTASAKQVPVLSHAIELIGASIAAAGGVKICLFVFTGKLSEVFKLSRISEDDVVYFLIGGIALFWLAFEAITRRLWGAFEQVKRHRLELVLVTKEIRSAVNAAQLK
jgi:hypothetical protein